MTSPIFKEQVQQNEQALARVEQEKLELERDRDRLAGLVETANAKAVRLQADLEIKTGEIAGLQRKLSTASQGQDALAELQRLKDEAAEDLRINVGLLEVETTRTDEQHEQIKTLKQQNSELAARNKALEKENAPMRPIVQALKDMLDAQARIEEQAGKL